MYTVTGLLGNCLLIKMAEKKRLVSLLKSKLDMVTSQKDELHGAFGAYIEQLKAQVQAVTETDEQQPEQLREMSFKLEALLEYLMRLNTEIKDAAVSGSPLQTPDTQGITAATLTSASTTTQDVSGSVSVDFSKLVQRINMVEMAMTGCQGEIRQGSAQQTDLKQQMEARCQNLEDKLESLESKHASEIKKQTSALEQKEVIERPEALNNEQYEELVKLEEKHSARFDDVEKQLTEVKVEYQEFKTKTFHEIDDVKRQVQKLKSEDKHKVTGQMKDVSHRLDPMNNPQHQTPVAFTAEFPYPGARPVTERSYIKDFTFMLCNVGACFNRDTGIFTAPRDGVCVTTVSLLQVGEGEVVVSVIHDRPDVLKREVCLTLTKADKTSSCGVGVVEVKAGDTLGEWVRKVVGKAQLSRPGSSFSCFFTDVGVPGAVWPGLAGASMGYKS